LLADINDELKTFACFWKHFWGVNHATQIGWKKMEFWPLRKIQKTFVPWT
jgi:hypothetical protein